MLAIVLLNLALNISEIEFISEAIVTLVAILGVFFSVKTLKKSDRSYQLTLKEIEKSDKRYRMNYMPLIKFEIDDRLVVEGLKFMSGEDVDFNISSVLKNVGLGPALNLKLKVETFYENKKNRFRDNGHRAGFDIEGAYSLPILKYDEGKWSSGISCLYFEEAIENIYVSLIGENEKYRLPENYLSGMLERTATDFFYGSSPRGHNYLIYYITIEYESLFGDKITTKQLVERYYTVENKEGNGREIDGVLYNDSNIVMSFKEKDIDIKSELLCE